MPSHIYMYTYTDHIYPTMYIYVFLFNYVHPTTVLFFFFNILFYTKKKCNDSLIDIFNTSFDVPLSISLFFSFSLFPYVDQFISINNITTQFPFSFSFPLISKSQYKVRFGHWPFIFLSL